MPGKLRSCCYIVAVLMAPSAALTAYGVESAGAAGDPYPLGRCPVSGEPLGSMGEPVAVEYDGREVQFCCAGCAAPFEARQAVYWEAIDNAVRDTQGAVYPIDACVVSGEPLGAGGGHEIVYRNRLIRLSSPECENAFFANPGKALSKLDEAVLEQNSAVYPTDRCPVSGEELGSHGKPVDYVIANRLVRLCCAACVDDLRARPVDYYPNPAAAAERAREGTDEREHDHRQHLNHGYDNAGEGSHPTAGGHVHGNRPEAESNPHYAPKDGGMHGASDGSQSDGSHNHEHMSCCGGGHGDHGEGHDGVHDDHGLNHNPHGDVHGAHNGHDAGHSGHGGRRGGHGGHGRGGHGGGGGGCC